MRALSATLALLAGCATVDPAKRSLDCLSPCAARHQAVGAYRQCVDECLGTGLKPQSPAPAAAPRPVFKPKPSPLPFEEDDEPTETPEQRTEGLASIRQFDQVPEVRLAAAAKAVDAMLQKRRYPIPHPHYPSPLQVVLLTIDQYSAWLTGMYARVLIRFSLNERDRPFQTKAKVLLLRAKYALQVFVNGVSRKDGPSVDDLLKWQRGFEAEMDDLDVQFPRPKGGGPQELLDF